MLDHISVQWAEGPASAAFYDAVLAPLGGGRVMDFGDVIGYGIGSKPDFWIGPQNTGEGFPQAHMPLVARDRETVRAFFEAATSGGAAVLYQPRLRPEYHPNYYGAFVRDP